MAEVLSPSELESLLAAFPIPARPPEVSSKTSGADARYDFAPPPAVDPALVPGLEQRAPGLARELAENLGALLRTGVQVQPAGQTVETCGEYLQQIQSPGCVCLVTAEPLAGPLLMDLQSTVLFRMIDRLLGGGQGTGEPAPYRAPTEIEHRLLSRVWDVLLTQIQQSWQDVCELNLQVVQVTDASGPLSIPPHDVVLISRFEITIDGSVGLLSLCWPEKSLTPMAGKLAGQGTADSLATGPGGAAGEPPPAKEAIVVTLAETRLTVAELRGLEIGDVIVTDQAPGAPLVVRVGDEIRFEAQPGVLEGRKAIRVTEIRSAENRDAERL
jgi:flagellar motor switch protein FliM